MPTVKRALSYGKSVNIKSETALGHSL